MFTFIVVLFYLLDALQHFWKCSFYRIGDKNWRCFAFYFPQMKIFLAKSQRRWWGYLYSPWWWNQLLGSEVFVWLVEINKRKLPPVRDDIFQVGGTLLDTMAYVAMVTMVIFYWCLKILSNCNHIGILVLKSDCIDPCVKFSMKINE